MKHSPNHNKKDSKIIDGESKINTVIPPPTQTFLPSISSLKFPFSLKDDQLAAVNAWMENNNRGTILYSTGTGKTEIAFECARRLVGQLLSHKRRGSSSKMDEEYSTDLISNDDKNTTSVSKQFETTAEPISKKDTPSFSFFNILFLVPRISLLDQTLNRLISYGIPKEKVGVYFGERKEKKEIMICTYHSVLRNPLLVRRSNMVIFDEVHLIRDTSKSFIKIFDIVIEDSKKAILGLTATLDERDFKNSTILAILPPVKRYSIEKAVKDKRLAKPVVIPIKVSLTENEIKEYNVYSAKIKNISNRFKRYDVSSMTDLLKKGGFASGMAKAWFANIRKRKLLLSYADNKLSAAANIIQNKFPDEKIMVFSETIESIEKLRDILKEGGVESKIIDAKVKTIDRQKILNSWGTTFNVLLSVHTLEIGYDVPQVRIEIILATTSNINQIVQRIGRVLRKYEGKNIALIYVVYVPDTKDDHVIEVVNKAITIENEGIKVVKKQNLKTISKSMEMKRAATSLPPPPPPPTLKSSLLSQKTLSITPLSNKTKKGSKKVSKKKNVKKENYENRIHKAYDIVESTLNEASLIVEEHFKPIVKKEKNNSKLDNESLGSSRRIYKVRSSMDKEKNYLVNLEEQSCTCNDFIYRQVKCKHIIAAEFIST
ncbi:UvrABC system protein B [Candidatus Nitrosocosmicus oleophilus]|jgi:superfamily II DNA or RNA helicase|uniref:UvrABC system protein B n=1 Tax=Candidatus Nitrosocosmicus oleophilus TaxID=1353260 RepID=A0A654MDX1_9ARCH|nr:DEAD/DEAH box helicase family protein [Candidatus Nitrosocosmicus oleophilus]ALI37682.1 UvrABC system protein B [Candidatus Nitrosocosmicus oleophilus]